MSSAPPLFVIPSDLRQAAGQIEQHGGQIENVAGVLRRDWDAFSAANDFFAESDVAAMCQRAFAELSRSQQICVELATALRLTADALEDADRRAAAIFRRPESSAGGGDSDEPSLTQIASSAVRLVELFTSSFLLGASDLVQRPKGHLAFSTLDGRISPAALGIEGGVAKDLHDFVRRVDTVDLQKVAKPLGVLVAIPHLVGVGESLSKGDAAGALVNLAGLGLGSLEVVGRSGVSRLTRFPTLIQDVPRGIYEAATHPDFADEREAAIIVKAAAPVVSTLAGEAAGYLVGEGVTAALTAICPIGAPIWAVVAGMAKITTSCLVENLVLQAIDSEATINFLDNHIDSLKSNLEATTQRIVNDVHDFGQAPGRDLKQLNPNTGSACQSQPLEVWR